MLIDLENDTFTLNHYFADNMEVIRMNVAEAVEIHKGTRSNPTDSKTLRLSSSKSSPEAFITLSENDGSIFVELEEMVRYGVLSAPDHNRPDRDIILHKQVFEIQITLQAYWKVFTNRFIDNIIQVIRTKFYLPLRSGDLLRIQLSKLQRLGTSEVMGLFEMERTVKARRDQLGASIERLEKALRSISVTAAH
ncbi:hypothetical protein HK102_004837 [Quaeritorhiza haematococci]|nr:hypothetical protein HK102_004837 [Quaeritorhiza haematococci]